MRLQSIYNPLSLLLLLPDSLPLLQHRVPPTGYSQELIQHRLQELIQHRLLTDCSLSRTAPVWLHNRGNSGLGMNCCSLGPPQNTLSARPPGASSCVDSSWAAASFRSYPPALVFMGCSVDLRSNMFLHSQSDPPQLSPWATAKLLQH